LFRFLLEDGLESTPLNKMVGTRLNERKKKGHSVEYYVKFKLLFKSSGMGIAPVK
jgi:hypothetical protein